MGHAGDREGSLKMGHDETVQDSTATCGAGTPGGRRG